MLFSLAICQTFLSFFLICFKKKVFILKSISTLTDCIRSYVWGSQSEHSKYYCSIFLLRIDNLICFIRNHKWKEGQLTIYQCLLLPTSNPSNLEIDQAEPDKVTKPNINDRIPKSKRFIWSKNILLLELGLCLSPHSINPCLC